jgi:hypothetical protein
MSDDKSSDELPEEVVRQIEDIVRKFHDQLSNRAILEGNIYRPRPAAFAGFSAVVGVSLQDANSGEVKVAINLSDLLRLDPLKTLAGIGIVMEFFNQVQQILINNPHAAEFILKTLAKFFTIPME